MHDTTRSFAPADLNRLAASEGPDAKRSRSGDSGKGSSGSGGGDGSGGGGGGGGPNKPGVPGPLRPSRGLFGLVMVLMVAAMLFMLLSNFQGTSKRFKDFQELRTMYVENRLTELSVSDSAITARTTTWPGVPEGELVEVSLPISPSSKAFYLKELKEARPDNVSFREVSNPFWQQLLISLLPVVLIIAVIWFFIARGLRSAGGGAGGMLGSFGKSRHRTLTKENVSVTFNDVAGIEEAKDEVTEIIEFLRNPKRFMKLGGRIPRGVLLIGEPGCGKTLLAKAIAGEADVPFFSISGSDFVEMFVGVGASRVRDLFKQAKESAPCIIFLDEIDAVGRRRGGGFSSGAHDERDQTLNAILVEMDGFNSADGVIVVAATNRSDVLDPALTRPGRFDRQITVPRPDVKGRLEILQVHAKKVKLGPDADMERVARATPMFSGADLASLINEAAIAATLHNKDFIEQEDLEEARDKVKFGRAKKSRVREQEDNKLVAYHEAGHAVLQALLPDADPLHKVTIIPRGQAGGATFSLPAKDRMGYGLKWLKATLILACGGRIAEERAMGDVSSGAVGDIAQVTSIAKAMVLDWGMSPKLGFVKYSGADTRETFLPDKDYSDETAHVIDEEVRRIVDEAYVEGKRMLEANWEQVVAVAEALLKYETLGVEEVRKLMRGEALGKPTVSDLLAAEAKRDTTPVAPKPAASAPPEIPTNVLPRPA